MKKFYKSSLFFFKVMNSFAMENGTANENGTQTVNKEENGKQTGKENGTAMNNGIAKENGKQIGIKEERKTENCFLESEDGQFVYYHDKNNLVELEKIRCCDFVSIHRSLFSRNIKSQKFINENRIMIKWEDGYRNFLKSHKEESVKHNIQKEEISKEIKSLEEDCNKLDSEIKNLNKKGTNGDLNIYNSFLKKIKANESNKNSKNIVDFLKGLKKNSKKNNYNEILKGENFQSFEQLKQYIEKKIDEITTLRGIKEKELADKKSKLKKIENEFIEKEKKLFIENLRDNAFYTTDKLFNIFDNIFLLKVSNMEKSLKFLFNSLEVLIYKGIFRGFNKYSYVNQHPLILKYCKKYDCTNMSILCYNLVNSICFYKNEYFRGISNLSGDFNICQFTKDKVNKFFFSYKYNNCGEFYIKYNINKYTAKFLFTLYGNKEGQDSCYIQEYGLKFYKNGGIVYELYIKDDKFRYSVNINKLKKNDYLSYLKLKYRKSYNNKECNKIYSIDDILKSIGIENIPAMLLYNDNVFKEIEETVKKINKNKNSYNILDNIKNLIKNNLFEEYFSINKNDIIINDIEKINDTEKKFVLNISLKEREKVVDNFKFTAEGIEFVKYITNDKNYSACNVFDKNIKEKSLFIKTYGYMWQFFQNTLLTFHSNLLNIYFDNRFLPLLNNCNDNNYKEYLKKLLEDKKNKMNLYKDFFDQKDKKLISTYDIGRQIYLLDKNSKYFTFITCFNLNIADYNKYFSFKFYYQVVYNFLVYLCDLQRTFDDNNEMPLGTYLKRTSKDFENYKKQEGIYNIFFDEKNTYRNKLIKKMDAYIKNIKTAEKDILEQFPIYLRLIYNNNINEIRKVYPNYNEQKNINISNTTEQEGINTIDSGLDTNNTSDSSDGENIYGINSDNLKNLKKIEEIRSWFIKNENGKKNKYTVKLINNDSKKQESKKFDIDFEFNNQKFQRSYNLQIVDDEVNEHPLDVKKISKNYFLDQKRNINFINDDTGLNIRGKDIITTYNKADDDFKRDIEKFFFDLFYLKDLSKIPYEVGKMSGNYDLLHVYFKHGSKSNRIYYYSKDGNIYVINKIGHNKEKKNL